MAGRALPFWLGGDRNPRGARCTHFRSPGFFAQTAMVDPLFVGHRLRVIDPLNLGPLALVAGREVRQLTTRGLRSLALVFRELHS